MKDLKIPKGLKQRIDNLYEALWKVQSKGGDITKFDQRILKLEKRYREQALGILLTKEEFEDLKKICMVKFVFPGSKLVGVSAKPTFWTLYSQIKNKTNYLNTTPTNGEGGKENMGFTIDAEEFVEPGTYDARITDVEQAEGKFGPRLKVTFDVGEGRYTTGFFAPKATPNNRTGMLFQKALGELRTADSDELVGKTVKVLIEHVQRDGRVYCNVSKIL